MRAISIYRLFLSRPWSAKLIKKLRKVSFPGLANIPLFDVVRIFLEGLLTTRLTTRAGAVAFRLMLAFFPTLFFLVQLVPFLPDERLPHRLLAGLSELLPTQLFLALEPGLAGLMFQKQSGFLSLSVFLGLWFSSNGMLALIQAFNASAFLHESRPGWQQRFWALAITLLLIPGGLLILAMLTWLGLWNAALAWFQTGLSWLFMFLVLLPSIGLLFRWAPSGHMGLRFISPGVFVASLFLLFFLWLLRWYALRFYAWNEVFGLLGSVPLMMLFLYASAMALLVGFETNLSWIRWRQLRKKRTP